VLVFSAFMLREYTAKRLTFPKRLITVISEFKWITEDEISEVTED